MIVFFCVSISLSSLCTEQNDTAWAETLSLRYSHVSRVTWLYVCVCILHAHTVTLKINNWFNWFDTWYVSCWPAVNHTNYQGFLYGNPVVITDRCTMCTSHRLQEKEMNLLLHYLHDLHSFHSKLSDTLPAHPRWRSLPIFHRPTPHSPQEIYCTMFLAGRHLHLKLISGKSILGTLPLLLISCNLACLNRWRP